MKLHTLHVENFGLHRDRQFDFHPDAINLLYGPNEAGKSTLLQLIRETLFGFPHISPYAFAGNKGKMAATLTARLANGQTIRFRRRKGKGSTVKGEILDGGDSIDDQRLSAMLGGASRELYEHVFGFSLKELESGEESLRGANLTETLFGSGLGNLSKFRTLREQLESRLREYYLPQGRNPKVNQLVSEIRDAESQMKEAMLRPSDYQQAEKACLQLETSVARLSQDLAEQRKLASRLEQTCRAYEVWRDVQPIEQQLQQLPAVTEITEAQSEAAGQLDRDIEKTENSIDGLRDFIDRNQHELESEEVETQLIEHETRIRSLTEELGRIRGIRDDLPQRRSETRDLVTSLRVRVEELGAAWTVDRLRKWTAAAEHREALEQVADELERVQSERHESNREVRQATEELEELQRRLTELDELGVTEDSLVELEQLAAVRGEWTQLLHLEDELERDRQASQTEAERLAAQFDALNSGQLSSQLTLPLHGVQQEFRQRLQQVESTIAQLEAERTAAAEERVERLEQIDELTVGTQIPSESELHERRLLRDLQWRRIRSDWLDSAESDRQIPEAERSAAADEFATNVAESDRQADQRFAHAERVARLDQLRLTVERLERRIEQRQQRLQESLAERDAVIAEWQAVWQPVGIRPENPAAMLEWTDQVEKWQQEAREVEARQLEASQRRARLATALAGIAQVVDHPSEPAEQLLTVAERFRDRQREATGRRDVLADEIRSTRRRLSQAERRVEDLQATVEVLTPRWQGALRSLELHEDYDPGTARRVLTLLVQSRQQLREVEGLEDRISDMQSELEGFQQSVSELCRMLAEPTDIDDGVTVVEGLAQRLDVARAIDAANRGTANELELARTKQQRHSEQLAALRKQLSELLEATACDDLLQFREAERVSRQRRDLKDRIDGALREIRQALPDLEPAQARELLAGFEPHDAEVELECLRRELQRAEEEFQQANRELGEAQAKLRAMDGQSRAAAAGDRLQSLYAQLDGMVDEWFPMVLAARLMQEALESFEKQHQPALLSRIAGLIDRMTEGRYCRIDRQLDETGTLLLADGDGQARTPDQLSTGTREQLYLAIRLAFLLDYCEQNEPLPVVMDDVLVNFDADRARASATVLAELSARAQVIYLTCHPHVVEMFERLDAPVQVLDLTAG